MPAGNSSRGRFRHKIIKLYQWADQRMNGSVSLKVTVKLIGLALVGSARPDVWLIVTLRPPPQP
jgi:hypothetical protein